MSLIYCLIKKALPLHQKSGYEPAKPGKPWLNQTYQAFDNYQLKLKAWLSLVLPGFQDKPGYNLP